MLPVDQAETLILSRVQPLSAAQDREQIALADAVDRILAVPVTSTLDFPHWDNSAMDGYAVRYADVQSCSGAQPVTLEIIEEIPAGYQPQQTVQPGQAARILTGSLLPAGADTIVMQEKTQRQGNQVTILAAPQPQAFVRHRASYYQAGATLLAAGTHLQAPAIAVLAAAQCAQVAVYRKPRVAILSTGSELVGVDQPLQPGQIVDSNQYALAALIAQTGAIPLCLGIVPDQPAALKQAMAQAIATADLVVSSGGVSVGDYDYVDKILAELGADIHIRAIAIKPGKPLTFATFAAAPTLYFGLPGNPVSALITFWRFVQPALRKLAGSPPPWTPTFVQATTRQALQSNGKQESYFWGQLQWVNGRYEFELAGGTQNSGNLINLAQSNGLARLALSQTQLAAGAVVSVLQIRPG